MKKRSDAFALSVIVFMLLFSLGGVLPPPVSQLVSLTAPYLAVIFGFAMANSTTEGQRVGLGEALSHFRLSRTGLGYTLIALAPAVLLILGISYATATLLGALGATDTPIPEEPLLPMLLNRALLPAVSEELLFRLLPLVLIAPYSRRYALAVSSLLFAVVHCNLFQIPYALVAGVIFMTLDLAFDSVIPSLILHFLNNAASVIWIKVGPYPTGRVAFFAVLGTLALLSAILLAVKWRRVREAVGGAFSRAEGNTEHSYMPLTVVAISLISAVLNLISR